MVNKTIQAITSSITNDWIDTETSICKSPTMSSSEAISFCEDLLDAVHSQLHQLQDMVDEFSHDVERAIKLAAQYYENKEEFFNFRANDLQTV